MYKCIYLHIAMCGCISIHKNMCVRFPSQHSFFFLWLTQHAGSHVWFLELSSLSFVAGCSGACFLAPKPVLLLLLLFVCIYSSCKSLRALKYWFIESRNSPIVLFTGLRLSTVTVHKLSLRTGLSASSLSAMHQPILHNLADRAH